MKYDLRVISVGIIVIVLAVALAVGNSIKGEVTARAHALETAAEAITWTHLSTENGDLDPPSGSLEQTASLILDINKDSINDFVIGARKLPGPTLVWHERNAAGWTRHVIESDVLRIEAGGAYHDIDNDDDLDIVMGNDSSGNEVWWWENPYPDYSSDWNRRLIKNSGGDKNHDQTFGDFDDDGKTDLVFWNQEDKKLILAEIPNDPRNSGTWNLLTIYSWSTAASHEGLAQADIDNDGVIDIVGGGRWFKLESGGASSLPDVGAVDDSDLILFTPTSLGMNTAGHFSLYFDGSDVDLSTDNEDIDAIAILENGDLVISTLGNWTVGSLIGEDEDLIRFAPINLGDNTSGTWSLYFDGSDVGLDTNGDEDVWGAGVDGSSGAIYLTLKGIFSVSGVSGDGADIITCLSASLGNDTSCAFDLVLDGSANGLAGEYLDGLALPYRWQHSD